MHMETEPDERMHSGLPRPRVAWLRTNAGRKAQPDCWIELQLDHLGDPVRLAICQASRFAKVHMRGQSFAINCRPYETMAQRSKKGVTAGVLLALARGQA